MYNQGHISEEQGTLDRYCKNIKDIPSLSVEEELDLYHKMKNGSIDARNTLIESQLKLMIFIIKTKMWDKDNWMELIQTASLNLIESIDKWNPIYRLSAWSSRCAMFTVMAYHSKYYPVDYKSKQQNEYIPIHETLSLNDDEILNMVEQSENGKCYQNIAEILNDIDISYLLNCLEDEDKEILTSIFGLDGNRETFQSIADRLGKHRETIRRIAKGAIMKIREFLNSELSDEIKKSDILFPRDYITGENNPMFGKTGKKNPQYKNKWVYNPLTKETKFVKKEEFQKYLDDGWIAGQKVK